MHCIKIFALRGMLGRSCGVKGLHFWPVRVRGLGFMGLKRFRVLEQEVEPR